MNNFKIVLTELINNEPVKRTLTMPFLPRKGDTLIIGDEYKEVVFVAFDVEDLNKEVTLLVNCIGNAKDTELQLLKKLTSSSNNYELDWL